MGFDWLNMMNLILCGFIVVLGFLKYKKSKNKLALYTMIAFCLFGISHLMTFLGIAGNMIGFLATVRLAAYLIVIFALVK